MPTNYAEHVSTRHTPQSESAPGKPTVPNSAGGYAFVADKWSRLDRFLILGADSGTYYIGERELTKENAACLLECADEDPARTVNRIVEVSDKGMAPKNDPAIFAIAMLAAHQKAKGLALEAMSKVCRTGTHLFQFLESVRHFRGRGRALRRAVRNWYRKRDAKQVAYQLVKYQHRNGWSQRDVLRLAKPSRVSDSMGAIFHWAANGWEGVGEQPHPDQALLPIWAFERAKRASSKQEICKLIRDYDLPRECIPTQFLNEQDVWAALLERMPMTAMIRNLGKMSEIGLLKPMSDAALFVAGRLHNVEALKRARVHPLSVLVAQKIYAQGRGEKGSLTWTTSPTIIDALDDAYYLAFEAVEPTNKRWLLGVDVSGSMSSGISGIPLSCRDAAAAMAMVTLRTEPNSYAHGFQGGIGKWAGHRHQLPGGDKDAVDGFLDLGISKKMRLDAVIKQISNLPFGGTDCAVPMLYATKNKIKVDVFVVLTDNETWANPNCHPFQAMREYRERMGINAKLIVLGMAANKFTIADPSDAGMLDICGFSTDVPAVMSAFVGGPASAPLDA